MSRTIKFRGKCFDNGQWAYGNLIIDDSGNCDIVDYENNYEIRYDVRGETIGQFTGLYDAGGKEIYDGDILGTSDRVIGYVKGDVRGYCYDVVYVNHPTGEKRWTLYSTVVDDYPNKIEVIGNIHDNPDLLLEKQQSQSKGVVLFGYQYLYQNGDLGFHEKMAGLGLSRGDVILGGLPNKCILANKHEYFLVDYYKEEDFCEQYKLKATYSVEDFIQGIKELKGETK